MRNLDPITGIPLFGRNNRRTKFQWKQFKSLFSGLTEQVDDRLQPLTDPITGQITTSSGEPEAPQIYLFNEGIEYSSSDANIGTPSNAYAKGQQLAQLFDTSDSAGRKVLELAFTTRFGQEYKVVGKRANGELSVLELYMPENQINSTQYQEDNGMLVAGTNGPTVQYRYVPGDIGLENIGVWWGTDDSIVWVTP